MTSNQENKFSMFYVVLKVCSAFIGVWSSLAAFVAAHSSFKTIVGKIEDALEAQEKSVLGVSKDKDALENAMIAKSLVIAKAVFAYANDIGNETLKSKVDFSESELKQVRDSVTLQRCQLIFDEATAVVGSLADYGVTNAELSDLQLKIDAFTAAIATPREATTQKKGATREIALNLKAGENVLKNKMDKLVENFKTSNPDFYRMYYDSRIIVDSGTRKTFLKGTVKKQSDNTPVEKAKVELIYNEGLPTERVVTVSTDKNGAFVFESVVSGEPTLKVSKEGLKTTEIDKVKIVRGRSNELSEPVAMGDPVPGVDPPPPPSE